MTNEKYIGYPQSELTKSFENTKAGKTDNKQKFRTEGLMHAARLLGVLSSDEVQAMMEQVHVSVFEESIADRATRKASLTQLKETSPDDYFDIPAIRRKP